MAGIGDKLWEMGRSPAQHLSVLVFGLIAFLTGFIAVAILIIVGTGPGAAQIAMATVVLLGVGAFFVTLALFIGAYAATGDSWTTTVWRIAQLFAAVLVLIFVFARVFSIFTP